MDPGARLRSRRRQPKHQSVTSEPQDAAICRMEESLSRMRPNTPYHDLAREILNKFRHNKNPPAQIHSASSAQASRGKTPQFPANIRRPIQRPLKKDFAGDVSFRQKHEDKEEHVNSYVDLYKTHHGKHTDLVEEDNSGYPPDNADDRIQCPWCLKYFLGNCPTHGPLVPIYDKQLPPDYHRADRAMRTLPDEFELRLSDIDGAGIGVWTKTMVNKGCVFNAYEGIKRPLEHEAPRAYSWLIRGYGCEPCRIDADDPQYSNWLRYVNCARNPEEENLIPFQYKGSIYYRTSKDIPANTELLVYYGHSYAEELGITPYSHPEFS